MSNLPLPTRAPSSAEIEAARQLLERIYQAPSASGAVSGSAAAQQAGGVLVKGASVALLTVGIWAATEQPAGLPVLQEHLMLHGPRGYFDQMERMLAEKGGDTQAARALRTTVMGMLDRGQVHSAGLILGESLAEAQRGGLISRHASPLEMGFDAAIRYSQQHPPQAAAQAPSAGVPAPPPPLAGDFNTVAQPPALTRDLQALRDRVNSGQYANSDNAYDQGVQAFNGLVGQVNALRRAGSATVDDRSLQVTQDELSARRTNSILSQYLRNAENGGPLPSSADMDRYMGGVREFNEATRQRYGRPIFDPATLDRTEQRLDRAIDFREDTRDFRYKATSGQFANSAQSYEQGTSELERLRVRSNTLAGEGLHGMTQQDYDSSLLQLEGRRINSVMSYVGGQLQQGQPIDPQITQSLVDRAENLNARSRTVGNGDFFDARTLDTYGDRNAIAQYRQDYREFNAQVLSGQFANSDEGYRQGQAQLQTLVDGANRVLSERGVQPLPQGTLDETGFQLEGRRINSQLSHLDREAEQGRRVDPEVARTLVEQAESLNTRRREAGGGDFFDAQTMRDYRELQRGAEQVAPPAAVQPPPAETPQTPPSTVPNTPPNTPAPQTPGQNDPDAPPANRPEAPQRDIEREWQEEFGAGELSEQIRREAERQGVSQEDVVDHARRNPSKTANEVLADVRDGQLSHGGTPPGNRPPGSSVAAPGEPGDTPPLDNLTIVRPKPGTPPDEADQRNFFQRTWDRVLDTQLPAVSNLTVFASQSGPDSKWQAGIPVDAGAALQKLQEYMANNVRGDSQASVDDFLQTIDPRRAGDVKVGSSALAGGVDFTTGFQRLQTLQVAIDGTNVNGGALRWDEAASAYQLKVTPVDGGYRLDGPLTVKPSESLTPLNISGSRLSGEAGDAVGLPSMSVKITDDYRAITLPAGTVLSQDNVDSINRALADPEYRSRAGTTGYGATAKASMAISEPRLNADDPANLFNRVFANGDGGEFGRLEAAARKLETSVSPGVIGIETHNAPLNSSRVGFELETRPGPTVRELIEAAQRLLPGSAPPERTPPDLRSAQPEAAPLASAIPALDARATALLADSRSSLEDMNRRVGVNPQQQVTETLVPEVAQRAYAAGFNEVARTDLNAATRQRDGSEIPAGTQLIASDGNERRVVVNIAEALQKTPEQAQASLIAQVSTATPTRDAAPIPVVAQELEQRQPGSPRIG